MRSKFLILMIATLAAPIAPAQAAVSDFRLPPDTSSQQPPPDRQGPIAPDVPESRRPAPTQTPAAREPEPAPVITPPPIVVPPQVTATTDSAAIRAAADPARSVTQPSPTPPTSLASEASAADSTPLPASTPANPPPSIVAAEDDGASPWPWALGGLLVFGAAGLAGWSWMRRRAADPARVPEIERPDVTPTLQPPPPSAAPAPPPLTTEPLQVSLEPVRLSLTLMNATLSWRLQVSNRGAAPLTRLTIGADMISAHASMSREEQLSGPSDIADSPRQIDRLESGESRTVEGEFRLPLAQIVPIRQGNAALLVPLARFRVEAEGARPVVRTFAVGQPGNGSGLQPFRLDQGPRVFPSLVQRTFA